jgi:multidrug efflux pump subunit AcrA (membrane-fusion protein)
MTKRLAFLFYTVALLLLGACSKKEQEGAEPIAPVRVTPVRTDSIQRIVTADAILYARDQASVMPKLSAPVRAFYVNRGDRVQKGQLLAVLENHDLTAAALESKGQYEQAQAVYRNTAAASVPEEMTKAELDVQAAQQSLDAAQKLYQSREQLFQDGALARKLVDEAQVAYVQARSQYETAQQHLRSMQSVSKEEQIKSAAAQVEAARGHYQAAEAQLEYSEIRSPISGIIADRAIYPGEMASAGVPLLTVIDVSKVIARANVPQNQAGLVKVGDRATILPTEGSPETPGKVIVVSPALDPNSTTLQVWVEAQHPGNRLKPGITVRVSIVAETLSEAIVVPLAALLPGGDGTSSVFVVGKDSVVHEQKIEVGIREGSKVQVLSGLAPGQNIVTTGGLGLQDGAKIRVEEPAPQQTSAQSADE